jgi:hypothetical protein
MQKKVSIIILILLIISSVEATTYQDVVNEVTAKGYIPCQGIWMVNGVKICYNCQDYSNDFANKLTAINMTAFRVDGVTKRNNKNYYHAFVAVKFKTGWGFVEPQTGSSIKIKEWKLYGVHSNNFRLRQEVFNAAKVKK